MSKFCGHCGSTLADNATFCPNCGAPAVDQAMAQQQFQQPQQFGQPQQFQQPQQFGQPQQFQQPFGGQPAFQPAMPGAAKAGMSKGAKTAIICVIGAVVIGLVALLLIILLGGGMEKPLKNHIKAYENCDYELFKDSLTAEGAFKSASTSSIPSESTFNNHVKRLRNTYGDDFKIEYKILEKEKVDLGAYSLYSDYIDEIQKVKVEFTFSGSKKSGTSTKTFRIIKTDGKWVLSGYLF